MVPEPLMSHVPVPKKLEYCFSLRADNLKGCASTMNRTMGEAGNWTVIQRWPTFDLSSDATSSI